MGLPYTVPQIYFDRPGLIIYLRKKYYFMKTKLKYIMCQNHKNRRKRIFNRSIIMYDFHLFAALYVCKKLSKIERLKINPLKTKRICFI
jgi:hypothetical protein